jgi:hypothetical protein
MSFGVSPTTTVRRAGIRGAVVPGAPARDRRQLGAVLGVGAEAALAGGEESAEAGALELQPRDGLEVAGHERQADAVARREVAEHALDAAGACRSRRSGGHRRA